jgi:hypothetical protein
MSTIAKQQGEFVSTDLTALRGLPLCRMNGCICWELIASPFEPFVKHSQAVAVPPQHFQSVTRPIAKYKQMT